MPQDSYRGESSTCTSRKLCEPLSSVCTPHSQECQQTHDSLACNPTRYLMERGQLRLYSCREDSKQLLTLQQAFNILVSTRVPCKWKLQLPCQQPLRQWQPSTYHVHMLCGSACMALLPLPVLADQSRSHKGPVPCVFPPHGSFSHSQKVLKSPLDHCCLPLQTGYAALL